jgi:undecaprenyl-diphosphatase
MFESLEQADHSLLLWLNQLGNSSWDGFWILVTQPEAWIPFYILFLFLLIWSNNRRDAILMIVTLLVLCVSVLLLTETVKLLVGRVRPNNMLDLLPGLRVLQSPKGYSFFSGHAASSMALSTFVFLELRSRWKLTWLIFIWPLFFTSSRLLVGVHFPSDLLAGGLFGMLLGYLFYRLSRRFKHGHALDIT